MHSSLDKNFLEDIANVINDEIVSSSSHFKYMQWCIAILLPLATLNLNDINWNYLSRLINDQHNQLLLYFGYHQSHLQRV